MSMITPLLLRVRDYASKYEVEVYRELNDCKFGLLLYEYCTKSAMGAMSDRCIDRSKNFCHRVVLATVYSTLAAVYYTFCTLIPVRVQLSSEIASSLVFGTGTTNLPHYRSATSITPTVFALCSPTVD